MRFVSPPSDPERPCGLCGSPMRWYVDREREAGERLPEPWSDGLALLCTSDVCRHGPVKTAARLGA